ncbi:MAG: polyprenyl diphosphate synthase, partial [Oceanospirillum sp.]|nr:polyprenyl diphosphate synthase [Oceanospirillum sp.]
MDSKKQKNTPRHIAIIMDGNNRWAKKRFLPGIAGHKAGADAVRAVIRGCVDQGVEVLTLFAFSSENWQRPQKEVNALMELFLLSLRREVKKLHKFNIRLRIIGDKSGFSDEIQQAIAEAEALTGNNSGLQLNIAANYG